MNISIYDTEHFETTYALIRIWEFADNKLTLFVSTHVAEQLKQIPCLDEERYKWHIHDENDWSLASKIADDCRKNNTDLLFLNTVSHHHFLFGRMCGKLTDTKVLVSVHDINDSFRPKWSLSPRAMAQYLGKKLLHRKAHGFVVLLRSMKDYLEQTYHPSQPVYCIPGSIYEDVEHPLNNITLTLVVPGSIDTERRDYSEVLSIGETIEARDLDVKVELLGSPLGEAGRAIVSKARELPAICTHKEKFISQRVYDKALEHCHLVWAPLPTFYKKKGNRKEKYGVSKSSGSFFDAVRFGKPVLLPASINISPELKEQCITYSDLRELSSILKELSENSDKYNDHKERAEANAWKFSLAKARKEVLRQFEIT